MPYETHKVKTPPAKTDCPHFTKEGGYAYHCVLMKNDVCRFGECGFYPPTEAKRKAERNYPLLYMVNRYEKGATT